MDEIRPYLPQLTDGLLVTLQITALGLLVALAVAFLAGTARMSRRLPVRLAAGAFVEVFRGTSVLVQLFWFFYVLPFAGIHLTPMTCAVIVLGLSFGAYGGEVVRGALQAVPRGQSEAAVALSLSPAHSFRRVILPQAIGMMIPSFSNLAVELLKATSVVSLITISELTFRADVVRASTGATTAVFGTVLVYYFVVAVAMSAAFRWLEHRVRVGPPARAGGLPRLLPRLPRRGMTGA